MISFREILIVIWVVCGLIDLLRGPTKHKDKEDGEHVDYACETAFCITFFWGLCRIMGCNK